MSNDILSKNIRNNRKSNGMTQSRLAEALYVSPQTVSKWESGLSEPDSEKLCAMADLFGISLDNLIRARGKNEENAYIAIDGGGTKTDFVLFSARGEVFERIQLGGCNPNAYGLSHTESILSEGIDKMVSVGKRIVGMFAGISGASVGNNREALNSFLAKRYQYFKCRVEGDIHNVISSVEDADRCIAVISGTGSVVYGYDGEMLHRIGGWGYLFDEAGSGFDIGRDLFRHCLACEDEGRTSDELYVYLSEALGGGVFANISAVYAKGKDYIASFAPAVFDFYDKGNSVAIEIVKKTATRLADMINQAHKSYDCGNLAVIAGGLTARRDILAPLIRKKVHSDIRLSFPDEAPILGAAVRCLKLFGESVDMKAFRENFNI